MTLRSLLLLMAALPASHAVAQVAALEAAVGKDPSVMNRVNLSQAYIDAGNVEAASVLLRQMVVSDAIADAAAWNNLCVVEVLQQDLNDATSTCMRAVGLAPQSTLAKNNLLWANAEVRREQDALAQQETVAPTRRDRDYFLAQGLHHMHLGQFDAAISSWSRMLLLNSNDAMAANNIGTALMAEGRPVEARSWFAKAYDWDRTMTLAKNNLAWAEATRP